MMIMTARERGRPGFGDRAHRLPLRLLAVAILASLAVLPVTSCQRRDDSVTAIRLAHGLPTSHPVHKAMERLAQRVAESSGGTMRIDIFPGEQLGTEREVLELMQIGSIGLGKVSCAVMESFVPEYEVLSLPYVFRDADHCWSVLQGRFSAPARRFRCADCASTTPARAASIP
jgi:TRAP-type C4-dicarboxylate transport system substrate-binding protein